MTSPFHTALPGARGSQPEPHSNLPAGFRAGSIAGIEIRVDASVLVIGLLIAVNLATGLLPAWHPGWPRLLVGFVALVAALLFFASILAHELSHALVGRHYGLPTRRITLFIFGGMAELEREPDRPKVELLTAAAGPALSIVLGVAATLMGALLARAELGKIPDSGDLHRLGPVTTLFLWLGPVNVMLGLFNLIPGFPLDGGRVLRAVLWWKTKRLETATRWAARAGQAVAAGLVISGILMLFGHRIPFLGEGFGQGIWLVLIGWFLNAAALRGYAQTLWKMRQGP
jgi:Zn-dependent protease